MKTVHTIFAAIAIALIFSLPASAQGLDKSAAEKSGAAQAKSADLRLILNGYTAYAEEHIGGTLRGLKLLSFTEEVKSGKWAEMKGLLARFDKSGINAAAVWYARPDGSYYTAGGGLAAHTLADRPYFPALMAGGDVVGYLVISKSTGARSFVIAVPVKNNGKVVGALGVSVSAEDMSKTIGEKLGLPENMLFYALDTKGQVSLHPSSDLLHVFPSDLGSPTLNNAIKKMLSEQEGEVSYEFRGKKNVVYKRSGLTGWTYAIGVVTGK
ncbi:MAG: cache domain-containing protein [Nitrospirota bacterium]